MFKLIINKKDGSPYWTEHFNSEAELNKWLTEEKTRKYWNKDYTTQILDLTPPPVVIDPQDEINLKAKASLSETDWYVLRFVETGVPIPAEVSAERAQARVKIVDDKKDKKEKEKLK